MNELLSIEDINQLELIDNPSEIANLEKKIRAKIKTI